MASPGVTGPQHVHAGTIRIALELDAAPFRTGNALQAMTTGQATATPFTAATASAPSRVARLIALTSARSVAVTMLASRPTP
jgi:hypothetical protein